MMTTRREQQEENRLGVCKSLHRLVSYDYTHTLAAAVGAELTESKVVVATEGAC